MYQHKVGQLSMAPPASDLRLTLEDVLRARIRTVGVQEYIFKLETGPDVGREWRIYDVG